MAVNRSTAHLPISSFNGRILFDVPMKGYTSLRIGGNADVMAFPRDENDLINLLKFAVEKGFPVFVLGNGTNLLVRDNGIRGVVINLSDNFREVLWSGKGHPTHVHPAYSNEHKNRSDAVVAIVAAGLSLPELVNMCKDKGLSGLEFAAGIPGTIGGAVIMNAGAYSGEMKDVIEKVEVVGLTGERHVFERASLKFSYRRCELPADVIITKVNIRLKKDDPEEIKKRMKELKERRKATQTINLPNAGSIFKNPEGYHAGKLIDESGLKGAKCGSAQISEVHGNYIVNLGNASAKDVLMLMAQARDKVYQTTGILLETEIKVVGED